MQLLSEESFIHYEELNFTNKLFFELLGEDIKLLSFNTSNASAGMGWFILKYLFIPKNYTVVFEHDRLFCTITVSKENGAFTYANLIHGGELKTGLNKQDILAAVNIVGDALKHTELDFYRVKKNRLVKEEN